jgi:hypothetical protein
MACPAGSRAAGLAARSITSSVSKGSCRHNMGGDQAPLSDPPHASVRADIPAPPMPRTTCKRACAGELQRRENTAHRQPPTANPQRLT